MSDQHETVEDRWTASDRDRFRDMSHQIDCLTASVLKLSDRLECMEHSEPSAPDDREQQ